MTASEPGAGNTTAVVVTHQPPAGLVRRVDRLLGQLERLVVVDNGSREPGQAVLSELAAHDRVRVARLGANRGVGTALNRGVEMAGGEGAQWVLCLDQDTRPGPRLLAGLAEAYRTCPVREEVAVVGANYRNPDTGRLDRTPERAKTWHEVPTVITAGSLLRLVAYREVGPFREDFVVDQVDHEYCLRARRHGWRVIQSTEPLMEQPVGKANIYSVGAVSVVTSGHPPRRRYYMVRNHLLVARAYGAEEPAWVLRSLVGRLVMVVRMLLLEGDRRRKLAAVLRGAADGLRGRAGRAPDSLREEGR